jgi:hypothetical protein
MTRKNNGFVMNIDWKSEDAGYSVLTSKKMIRFALYNKNNLIQTYKPFKLGKTKLYLRAISVQTWPNTPTWDEIKCTTVNSWIKTTPCDIGSSTKMFVKLKGTKRHAGLGSYIYALSIGQVTKEHHKLFVHELMRLMQDKNILIHNEEVDWFHLKGI